MARMKRSMTLIAARARRLAQLARDVGSAFIVLLSIMAAVGVVVMIL